MIKISIKKFFCFFSFLFLCSFFSDIKSDVLLCTDFLIKARCALAETIEQSLPADLIKNKKVTDYTYGPTHKLSLQQSSALWYCALESENYLGYQKKALEVMYKLSPNPYFAEQALITLAFTYYALKEYASAFQSFFHFIRF